VTFPRILVAASVALAALPAITGAAALRSGDFVMVSSTASGGYPYSLVSLDGVSSTAQTISTGGLLNGATDVVVRTAGDVLLTVPGVGVVKVQPSDGAQSIFAPGSVLGDGTPSGIAVGQDGAIYVSLQSTQSRVVQLSAEGAFVRIVTTGGYLPLPAGMCFGPDAALYVCATLAYPAGGGGGLVRVDPASGSQTPIASNDLLKGPFHVALAPDGTLWSVQYGGLSQRRGGCVVKTRISDGYSELAPMGPCTGQGIAIRQDGATVVGDCMRINGDCNSKVTYEYPGGTMVWDIGGPVAVVPDIATPTLRRSWGQLKAIYR
jgi:hypothetical protein